MGCCRDSGAGQSAKLGGARRFKGNPLVTGAPHIRFYAGAPLVTSNGMRLGSLCVIDVKPRNLDAEQLMVLANFAEVVVREIEKDIARVSPFSQA